MDRSLMVPQSIGQSPLVPYYESEELAEPRVVAARKRFVSADSKDEGKLTIARNLCNMDDRLEYIEELTEEMQRQIRDTDMVSVAAELCKYLMSW